MGIAEGAAATESGVRILDGPPGQTPAVSTAEESIRFEQREGVPLDALEEDGKLVLIARPVAVIEDKSKTLVEMLLKKPDVAFKSQTQPDGKVRIELEVRCVGKQTPLKLVLVNIHGTIEEHEYTLEVHEWEKIEETVVLRPRRPYRAALELGLASVSYGQSSLTSGSQGELSGRLSGSYRFRKNGLETPWSAAATFWSTLAPFAVSPTATRSMYLMGANLRGGYSWTLPAPWELTTQLGYTYLTMGTPSLTFGFRNAGGLQLGVDASYTFNEWFAAQAFLKFSPIGNVINLTDLGSNEFAFGVSGSYFWKPWLTPIAGLYYSRVRLVATSLEVVFGSFGLFVGAAY